MTTYLLVLVISVAASCLAFVLARFEPITKGALSFWRWLNWINDLDSDIASALMLLVWGAVLMAILIASLL